MYSNIKSCLVVNGEQTEFFSCNVGLRQGKNLSPFLIAIYLNDMENFFLQNGLRGGVECLSSNLDDEVLSLLDKFKVTSEHVWLIGHCPLM